MILDATIQQLRMYCPPFNGNVAGAADFRLGLQEYNAALPQPAAYVVLLEQESDGPGSAVGEYQFVREIVGVIVELDARADRRGQDPANNIEFIKASLNHALLNWKPEDCITQNNKGFWYSGARFLDLDRARMFYQFEYALTTILDDSDGWQEPFVPLDSIILLGWHSPPQDMYVDDRAFEIHIDTLNATPIPSAPQEEEKV